jgi:hypothetical protein
MRSINSFPPPLNKNKKTEKAPARSKLAKSIVSLSVILYTTIIYSILIGALVWSLEIEAPASWRIFLAVLIVQFLRLFDCAVIQVRRVGLEKD